LGREPGSAQSVDLTSPGMVYKNLLIVGGRNPETLPAPPGDVRAFDVRTGELRWSFHTVPRPSEFGYDTWPKDAWKTSGAANNWMGMAVDSQAGNRLCSDRLRGIRFLWRRSRRRQSVCQ